MPRFQFSLARLLVAMGFMAMATVSLLSVVFLPAFPFLIALSVAFLIGETTGFGEGLMWGFRIQAVLILAVIVVIIGFAALGHLLGN